MLLTTHKVSAGSRLYYFDMHTDRSLSPYITITEITMATGQRTTLYLHPEDFDGFRAALDRVIADVGEFRAKTEEQQ